MKQMSLSKKQMKPALIPLCLARIGNPSGRHNLQCVTFDPINYTTFCGLLFDLDMVFNMDLKMALLKSNTPSQFRKLLANHRGANGAS